MTIDSFFSRSLRFGSSQLCPFLIFGFLFAAIVYDEFSQELEKLGL